MSIAFGAASSEQELRQILELQRRNYEEQLSPEEVKDQGFVTVRHDFELLRDMNAAEPHVIATSDGRVVGYALVMLREFEPRIPILEPMYALFDRLEYRGRVVEQYRCFIMGQVCIDKPFRGRGVFEGLFEEMRRLYAPKYELVLTEVARRNPRSIRAHAKVGFELVHRYRDRSGEEWDVIGWSLAGERPRDDSSRGSPGVATHRS